MTGKRPAHRPSLYPVVEMDINGDTYQATERVAVKSGNSAAVGVPKDWIGSRILCIKLE